MTDPLEIDTARRTLGVRLPTNEADADTVRDYLVALLYTLWREGEGFSGKRPFGDSGWQYDLYVGLVEAGLIEGTLDADGFAENIDRAAGNRLILAAIEEMGRVDR